jgi:hypothetical protein
VEDRSSDISATDRGLRGRDPVRYGRDEEVPHGVRALLMDFGIRVPACPAFVGDPAAGRHSISRRRISNKHSLPMLVYKFVKLA